MFVSALSSVLAAMMALPPQHVIAQALSNPPPAVIGWSVNRGDPQRSTVTNISLTFSTNVALAARDVVVQQLGVGVVSPTNFLLSHDGASNQASLTFPGLPAASLPDGNFLVSVRANTATNAPRQKLDGNNDGRPGDAYTLSLFRYFGDWSGDRDVDFQDNYWFQRTFGKSTPDTLYDARFDFDADGVVNSNDLVAFVPHYFTILPPRPGIFAALVNDTGASPSDGLTTDPTIAGTVLRTNPATVFRASLGFADDPPAPLVDATADLGADGGFWFTSNRLAQIKGSALNPGSYRLHLETVDAEVVSSAWDVLFTLQPEVECLLTPSAGWTFTVSPATGLVPNPVPGSVQFTNCEAVLTEGDSFLVTLERRFVIPANAGLLCVTYQTPTFDTGATNLMRDAFEAALVDGDGRPLTFSIQGSAGVPPASASTPATLPASPDAFFNHSDGRTPFAAPGTAVVPSTPNPQLSTIFADVSQLPAGSTARLILRLVNNDRDRATSVRVAEVSFKPVEPSLNLDGSLPPALSLLTGTAGRNGGSGGVASSNCADALPNFSGTSPGTAKVVYGVPGTNGGTSPTLKVDAPSDGISLPVGSRLLTGSALADGLGQGDTVQSNVFLSFNGFEDPSRLQLNRSAATTNTPDGTVLRVCPAITFAGGSAFSRTMVNAARFSTYFTFRVTNPGGPVSGCNTEPGADGLVFAVQATSSQVGSVGGGIGFSGIPRSVGVEFDTWCNEEANDPNSNHLGIDTNGNTVHGLGAPFTAIVTPNFDDGNVWHSWVDYDGTNLEVRVNQTGIRPAGPQLSRALNITNILRTNLAFVGFTSATGDDYGNYDILKWQYNSTYSPIHSFGPSRVTLVTVNGQPVEALDGAGNFFSAIQVRPGQNIFTVVATDALGQSTTNIVTVFGATCPDNFSSLGVVSASVLPEYGRTTFNEWTATLYADVALRNTGTYPMAAPLYVGVTALSDPTVQLLSPDGVSADGVPYYDFSAAVTNPLTSGALGGFRTLAFRNPNRAQFSYQLVVLGQLNRAPSFTSKPRLEAIAGRPYAYDSKAVDPDGDPLGYSLVNGPAGLTVEPLTGVVAWTPGTNDIGNHDVTLRASDGRGGVAEQRYLLSVINPPSNRPPYFVSTPVTVAHVATGYRYDSEAVDPDFDPVTYSLLIAPTNMTVNPVTGLVQWGPTASQVGDHTVTLQVVDGRGGTNFQSYVICVLPTEGNRPPVIVSTACSEILLRVPAVGTAPANDQVFTVPGYLGERVEVTVSLIGSDTGYRNEFGVYLVADGSGAVGTIKPTERGYAEAALAATNSFVIFGSGLPGGTGSRITLAGGQTYAFYLIQNSDSPTWRTANPSNDLNKLPLAFFSFSQANPDNQFDHLRATVSTTGSMTQFAWEDLTGGGDQDFNDVVFSLDLGLLQGDQVAYRYQLGALDPDADALNYELMSGPIGMVLNPTNGLLLWISPTNQFGLNPVRVRVSDGRGGSDEQSFVVNVQLPGNAATHGTVFTDVNRNGTRDERQLVPNGDFSQGNVLFDSEYAYTPSLGPASTYFVGSNPQDHNGAFSAFGDHTSGSNLMMIVNGSTSGNSAVWSQTNSVTPNTRYRFAAWGASCFPNSPANLQFTANGTQIGTNFVLPTQTGQWIELFALWDSGTNQSVNLQIRNYEGAFGGNDFALDDIGFGVSEPGLPNWTVYLDLNMNGRRDTCEPFTLSQTDGTYAFSNLTAGIYPVAVERQSGWIQTAPSNGFHQVVLSNNQTLAGLDFGITRAATNGINGNPAFVTAPPADAVPAGQLLRYDAFATDPDGDLLAYDLVARPEGMLVEANSGVVVWRPTLSQLGAHEVILRAQDGRGGVALQSFQVAVVAPNSAPVITTFPPVPAVVNLPYQYAVRAQDAENEALAFALGGNPPAGMTLTSFNSSTAVLNWTPALGQVGTNRVVIVVRDPGGLSAQQSFDLVVVPSAPNSAPFFTSTPRTQARIETAYVYAAHAADANGDPLDIALIAAPAGMVLTNAQPPVFNSRSLVWTPTAAQLGNHAVTLRVSDGRGGSAEQQFVINVTSTLENLAPSIVSLPPEHATAGQLYEYNLAASDPEGDPVTWRLVSCPAGVSLDAETGALRWNPTLDQLGTNAFVVEARDTLLATAVQLFNVTVGCVNRPPQITSIPPVAAQTSEPYLYTPRGSDPDGDRLAWSLVDQPAGMTIDAGTGLIRWTPATNQAGPHNVAVRASDGRGGSDTQRFTLTASDLRANRAPVIVTTPQFGATVERLYAYTVRATDADGDTLALQLLSAPAGATLTPTVALGGSVEGVVSWSPTLAQVGSHEFIVAARDPANASAAQRFLVTVRANQPPVITSIPPTNAVPGVTYRYDVRAADPDNDALGYTLAQSPAGMTVDALGRVAWTPTPGQAGGHPVTVTVRDGFGGSATQSFVVNVAADTQPPVVSLSLVQGLVNPDTGQWAGDLGSTIRVRVNATDNIGVVARSLRLGGQELVLGTDGVGTFVVTQAGLFDLTGSAADGAGNTASASRPIQFRDPRATNDVFVRIHSPTNTSTLTTPVPIVATITNALDLVRYRVDYAPADLVDLDNLAAPNPAFVTLTNVLLPPGIRAITNAALATLDPTVLLNDNYVLRVFAEDVNGTGWYEPALVGVSGDLKFGEFRLEFTDLVVPLVGIPITVNRVYDTRNSVRRGDFGYGWNLGVQDAQIREGLKGGTLYNGSKVYLNTPDGRRVGFTAYPADPIAFGFVFVRVKFQPDPGVYERLEINGDNLAVLLGSDFLGGLGDEVFNPDNYKLTLRDGTVYEYSQSAGLQRITDLNGNQVNFTRDGVVHSSGSRIEFQRDAQGRITRIVDPAGISASYAYDTLGDLRGFTDTVGSLTQYRYSTARAHFLTNIVDPLGKSALTLEYDASGKLAAVRDANGNLLTQEFDVDTRTARFVDGNGHTNISRFDANGNETMRAIPGITTNFFVYDANNNLLSSTNGRGFGTNYTYDTRGNVTSIRDALGNRTTIAYNDQSKPVGVTNALGQILNLRYDGAGKLLEVINNAGLKTTVTRDSQGRVASLTDAAGHTTQFDYTGGCSCGKPGKVINPDGSFKLTEYDSLGNTTRTVNELGAETLSFYDSAGKLLWTRDPLSNYTRFFYNGPLLTNVVDALGRSTRYEYDALNRTNAIIDAEGGVTRFEYDGNGNRTKVIDAVSNVTTFVYDAANRLIRQIDPLGNTNFFAYDAAGNRIEAIDRNGRKRTFAYDAANRMTNELWWEGTNVVRSIVFGFNELGVQTLAADPAARYEYSYDALNRLERVLAQSAGVPDFTLLYTYTALGQVESVTDHWGVRVGSGYDNRNRLASRTWSSTLPGAGVDAARVDFAYDVSGNRVRTDRFAELAGTNRIGFTTNAYNRAGIVTNITHLGPTGSVLAKYDYNFDAAFQITRWAIGNQLSDFAYDRTGQLTNALNTAQPNENFRFDANGNRVGAQSGGSYVVGGNNQVLSDGTNRYAYDFEGNMTSRSNTVTGVLTTYQWDHRNRLVSVLDYNPGGVVTQTVAFVYDAMNRRLAKTVNGQTTRFLYNGDDSWADLDGSNAVTARYLHGARIDELLARQRASDGRGWYLTDHLGTVRDLANATGAVVAHVDYSSFGQVLGVSNPGAVDRFLFTGREFDGEIEIYFYRERFYSAALGRFLSEDPIRFDAEDSNLNRYAANAPTMLFDPTGTVVITENLNLRALTQQALLQRAPAVKASIDIARLSSIAIRRYYIEAAKAGTYVAAADIAFNLQVIVKCGKFGLSLFFGEVSVKSALECVDELLKTIFRRRRN